VIPNPALALRSEDIQKSFGSFIALAGITMEVKRGEFVAMFGRNGAGKTTFLKIAATLMRSSHGSLAIEGLNIDDEPERVRSKIGFLSHNTYIYRDLSPIQNLRFFARLYGVSDSDSHIIPLLDRVGLKRRANDPVRSFSRGLQQRIGIARTFLHNPSLVLLDEPYTGLDANAVQMLDDLLDETVRAGHTVILTTHNIEHGLRAATRAAIIDRGKLVFDGEPHGHPVHDAYDRYVRLGTNR
jgi:heme ABC exporter ATP-binding subunit CcmA